MIEGERVLGRFTVGERLGRGGHGTVHRAWDERLCRWVAVKEIPGESGKRVARECQAAARLNHPSIVTLYEMGTQGGSALLISELVDGSNVRELASQGELSDRDVADLGSEIASALAHAHRAGVVHRDVKPDNVLRRGDGSHLLTDFGIAGLDDAPTLTATGEVLGTLAYMSPEQASGGEIGPPSDVYSLGVTLYELWTGESPFARPTPAATARAIGEPVVPLSEIRPELPDEVCAAVERCLEADPDLRPSTSELREALLDGRGGLHPDRLVPRPRGESEPAPRSIRPTLRPLPYLAASAAIVVASAFAGLAGLALVLVAAAAPALMLLGAARERGLAVLAPLLGLAGAAPAFLGPTAGQANAVRRACIALTGWVWTGIAGALLGRSLGVPLAGSAGSADGWTGSAGAALDGVLLPLLGPESLAIALTWIGAVLLLGLLLDAAPPAPALLGGLLWAGAVVALSGAAGDGAVPTPLLAPALLVSVAWAIWDREGRPALRRRADPRASALQGPGGLRSADPARLPDPRERARRVAGSHVRAALHGAGSRAGVP